MREQREFENEVSVAARSDDAIQHLRGRRVIVCDKAGLERLLASAPPRNQEIEVLAVGVGVALEALRAGLPTSLPSDLLTEGERDALRSAAERASRVLIDRASNSSPRVEIVRRRGEVPVLDRREVTEGARALFEASVALERLDRAGIEWSCGVVSAPWTIEAYERVTPARVGDELIPSLLRQSADRRARRHWRPGVDVTPKWQIPTANELRNRINRLRFRWRARGTFTDFFRPESLPPSSVVLLGRAVEYGRNPQILAELRTIGSALRVGSVDRSYRGSLPKTASLRERFDVPPLLIRRLSRMRTSWSALQFRTRMRAPSGVTVPRDLLAPGRVRMIERLLKRYFSARWGVLSQEWLYWHHEFIRARPSAVIGFRTSSTSLIPLHAAVVAHAAAISLPHGVVDDDSYRFDSDPRLTHVTPFRVDEAGAAPNWQGAGWSRILREYPKATEPHILQSAAHRATKVLVLVDGGEALASGVGRLKRNWDAFEEFARRGEKAIFVIKDHPGQPLYEVFAAKAEAERLSVEHAAREADLHGLLSACDRIVLFDYFGSAAVHALETRKPLVRLEFDGLTRQRVARVARWWAAAWSEIPVLSDTGQLDAWLGRSEADGLALRTRLAGTLTHGGRTLSRLVEDASTA